MWTRLYLLLLLVRIYFAFCASYLHPDEHFQGPEVIAGPDSNLELLCTTADIAPLRRDILLSCAEDVGMDIILPNPKRFPAMASLWSPDDSP